jgi:hypothetical protein
MRPSYPLHVSHQNASHSLLRTWALYAKFAIRLEKPISAWQSLQSHRITTSFNPRDRNDIRTQHIDRTRASLKGMQVQISTVVSRIPHLVIWPWIVAKVDAITTIRSDCIHFILNPTVGQMHLNTELQISRRPTPNLIQHVSAVHTDQSML